MKKALVMLAVMLILSINKVWAAGPYSPNLTSDVYDSTPDATPTPNQNQDHGGADNNDIYHAVNVLLGTGYTVNEEVDPFYFAGADNIWQEIGGGNFNIIGLGAGYTNTLLVYDITTPATKIDVFGGGFTGFGLTGDGSFASPFPSALSPFLSGTQFGFALSADGTIYGEGINLYDSNPASNVDGLDRMITYHLGDLAGKSVWVYNPTTLIETEYTFQDPYLLVWEDGLPNRYALGVPGDEDYNDMQVLVDRVVPVPEPMTLTLLGSGLVGMLGMGLRRIFC